MNRKNALRLCSDRTDISAADAICHAFQTKHGAKEQS